VKGHIGDARRAANRLTLAARRRPEMPDFDDEILPAPRIGGELRLPPGGVGGGIVEAERTAAQRRFPPRLPNLDRALRHRLRPGRAGGRTAPPDIFFANLFTYSNFWVISFNSGAEGRGSSRGFVVSCGLSDVPRSGFFRSHARVNCGGRGE